MTINRELALLKTLLNKAEEWEKIKFQPVNWKFIKKYEEVGREPQLSQSEKPRLFTEVEASGPYPRNFLLLDIKTGLRTGEIPGLR
jgi:integrase